MKRLAIATVLIGPILGLFAHAYEPTKVSLGFSNPYESNASFFEPKSIEDVQDMATVDYEFLLSLKEELSNGV